MPDAKELLGGFARELGFAWCGVTSAAPLENISRYDAWLEVGRHAEMEYLANENARRARAEPRRLVPLAQSIVVCAALYPPPTVLPADIRLGGMAAYAVGDDYHEVLSARLWELCRRINMIAGRACQHRVYTDSGPVLERELAVRAGIGWIGKNSMAIHPRFGSHFFLAEIITEYSFAPDLPDSMDRCGACRRCVLACPAGCILPDRTIDSSRCLAYLTIEKRGSIPREQRKLMDRWVFGCDICQSVCPWNHKSVNAVEPCFQPRSELPYIDLVSALGYSEMDFAMRFRKSALRRARRDGFRRNLILAAGNSKNPEALPGLSHALADPDPLMRAQAAWALGRQDSEAARAALRAASQTEEEVAVLEEISESLKGLEMGE
jgi:epoxyqueuosine reductase